MSKELGKSAELKEAKFANIDVFDIEIDETDPAEFIKTVARLEPTFGAINLGDIKAPECFEIEQALRERMRIPVLYDDQLTVGWNKAAISGRFRHLQGRRKRSASSAYSNLLLLSLGATAKRIAP